MATTTICIPEDDVLDIDVRHVPEGQTREFFDVDVYDHLGIRLNRRQLAAITTACQAALAHVAMLEAEAQRDKESAL